MSGEGTPSWATKVFRLLLRLYPARFRDDWQDEMESVLRSDRLDRNSPQERRRFWIRTLASVLVTAPREHALDLWFDLRYVFRTLRRRPVFLGVSVLSMGVGIGAATIVMATLSALFLHPLQGVGHPEELVNVKPYSSRSESFDSVSYPDYLDLRETTTSLSDLAAFRGSTMAVRGEPEEEPKPVLAQIVTANYLSVLRVLPSQGRFFSSEEDRAAAPVVIVSHWFWENRLGARSSLGELLVNGESMQVVGVGPPGFRGNFKAFPSDLFLPLAMSGLAGLQPLDDREARTFELVGRLGSGQRLANAAAEFDGLGRVMAQNHPSINSDIALTVEPMTGIDADFRSGLLSFLLIFLAVTGLVLAIAALNVAGMMASRATERAQETVVRLALGAPRHRLRRQLLVETLVIGLLAAALGIAMSVQGVHWVAAAFSTIDSRITVEVVLDKVALITALALAFAVALIASLASGSVGHRRPMVLSQRGVSSNQGGAKHNWRRALVVGQVLLSFVVLTCAMFFLRALNEAASMDLGFDPNPVAVASLRPRLIQMESEPAQRFFEQLVDAVEELPAVEHAALITRVPLGLGARFFPNQQAVRVPGHEPPPRGLGEKGDGTAGAAADDPGPSDFAIESAHISAEALNVLGIDLVAGRSFERSDGPDSVPVAVVNEVLADKFFDGDEALGGTIFVEGVEHTIVGVARNSKYRTLDESPAPFLYLSFYHRRPSSGELIAKIRAAGNPPGNARVQGARSLLPTMREAQRRLAPDLPVQDLELLTDRLASSLLPQRVGSLAAGSLGLLGLFLSAVGLAGVLAHWVDSRRREIGLRMSVGARPSQVMTLVLGQGASLTLLGIGLGIPVSYGLSRALAGFLYGVSALDPWTYLAVAVTLAGAAFTACTMPVLRALRVDPLAALRSD